VSLSFDTRLLLSSEVAKDIVGGAVRIVRVRLVWLFKKGEHDLPDR
jgi:hypothetical protein